MVLPHKRSINGASAVLPFRIYDDRIRSPGLSELPSGNSHIK